MQPSAVTQIMTPVVTGIAAPVEERVNDILDVIAIIPIVGTALPPLDLGVADLLADAAAGNPISLQVFDTNGNLVAPGDDCNVQADGYTLAVPRGIEIGGNRISGLGADGQGASAGALDAIAFGNDAVTGAGAGGAVAIGSGAQVSVANSVAIGAGAVASRGAQLSYAAFGLDDDQLSAGEVAFGAAGAERQLTHVAAGSAPTDAVNVAQLQGVAGQVSAQISNLTNTVSTVTNQVTTLATDVAALADAAVLYDGPARDRVTLAGPSGTVIDNVAPGTLAAGSAEAVNGSQLFDTNQQVAALEARTTLIENQIGGTPASPAVIAYSNPAAPTLPNGGTPTNDATLVGAAPGPVRLHNVADAALVAGGTGAVNAGQLYETNAAVAAVDARVDGQLTLITDLDTRLTALDVQVAGHTTTIANLTTLVTNLEAGGGAQTGPVRYSDAATPTTPNGDIPSNHATLVGVGDAPVGLHNVADGALAAGSTDAVNGGQLHSTNQAVASVLAIADEALTTAGVAVGRADQAVATADAAAVTAGEARTLAQSATLRADQAFTVATDAAGAAAEARTLAEGATVRADQAVATADAAAVVAGEALQLGQNSVQYGPGGTTVTLGLTAGAAPVLVQNVAPGVSPTDAVNVSQLQASMQSAVADAAAYTDLRIDALGRDLTGLRRDANGGTAGALAVAALPQATEPGRNMVSFGLGHFQGQSAVAMGLSTRLDDRGQTVLRAGATVDTRGRAGANAGMGIQF